MSGVPSGSVFLSQGALFDMAHRLVAEVAGEAAAEAQRRRNRRDAVAPEPGARVLERIGLDAFQADVGAARVAQQAPHAAPAPPMRSAQARPMNE